MMNPNVRKVVLTTHIAVSVGWIGAVVVYLVLVIAAMTDRSGRLLRATWIALELIGRYGIVPLAVSSLISGIAIAFGTPWGLFRHYWVATSLLLTAIAAAVLVQHMSTVSFFARIAADGAAGDVRGVLGPALRGELLHAGVGLAILLGIETLNVFKPRGLTAYGRRRAEVVVDSRSYGVNRTEDVVLKTPRWVHVVWIHAAALLLLFATVHVIRGGLRLHN